jgi:hypothetical protein
LKAREWVVVVARSVAGVVRIVAAARTAVSTDFVVEVIAVETIKAIVAVPAVKKTAEGKFEEIVVVLFVVVKVVAAIAAVKVEPAEVAVEGSVRTEVAGSGKKKEQDVMIIGK